MNIFEFSERYKIKLTKARLIQKENPDWFNGSVNAFAPLRATLAHGNPLTSAQLVQLIENPEALLEQLGKYAAKAHEQLSTLGKPENQVAPKEVAANIWEAAKGEPEALEILIAWLKEVIPLQPVEHNFLAVRLLLGVAENQRQYEAPRIRQAFRNCRGHESFTGFWRVEKRVSRNVTVYQKATEKGFDL